MESIKVQVGIVLMLELVALILLVALGLVDLAIALVVIVGVNATVVLWILYTVENERENRSIDISRILGKEAKGAFDFGEVGIITYNDQYEVTWVSSFLISRGINIVGKKATSFIAQIEDLFQGEMDTIYGTYKNRVYELSRKEQAHVLFVRDITRLSELKSKYESESLVVGLIHMDNYADIQAFEDETTLTNINLNLRQPIVNWANDNGIIIRRLRSDRFFLILNEDIYDKIANNKFDILTYVRGKAAEIDVNITLSMAFARGHTELMSLDEMVSDLLELAQSRGGDQVAVKRYGDDVKYYGGKSEATSTRSRVRVRVMAQAIKEVIMESNQIFISGHKDMDFDCMGANLAISQLVQSYGKKAYIVSQSGGLESHLKEAMEYYDAHLSERHNFISDDEALRMQKKNDLMIILDYHNPAHSNAPKLLNSSERVMVLDHHRRGSEFIKKPILVYLESSASSTCELISELIAYQPGKVGISEVEATIMYLGILVDTNRFKMRTGFRTFEACAQLKKWGVDPVEAEALLKENYDEFEAKINVLKYSKMYNDNIIISCVDDTERLERSLMSIGADSMLSIKNVEAAFVVGRISENQVAISARSKGVINVQVIMEELQGGGHFTA
ncbi:DHH family phosphoesterase, partial [Breznakia sp. OttesenSCG-928-G09]|nr:DHH family phosphoesterase [Breznakia sp. OttesenSCG-928-G09]